MSSVFPLCAAENREIDGYDLLSVLGLMKEYNWREIWRRYHDEGHSDDTVSIYVAAKQYFMEMHIQKMRRIILSEKFNTNPFFMQQVIQRITCSHAHDLIMRKIRTQGIDTGENPLSLSCSLGNVIIDFIANKNEGIAETAPAAFGRTHIEQSEKRPLDIYDFSSTLYLLRQNLTGAIYRRYGSRNGDDAYIPEVELNARVGDYRARLVFEPIEPSNDAVITNPGNVSAYTMHQILQRISFGHAPGLMVQEAAKVGITLTETQLRSSFRLRRLINNTSLTLECAYEA